MPSNSFGESFLYRCGSCIEAFVDIYSSSPNALGRSLQTSRAHAVQACPPRSFVDPPVVEALFAAEFPAASTNVLTPEQ